MKKAEKKQKTSTDDTYHRFGPMNANEFQFIRKNAGYSYRQIGMIPYEHGVRNHPYSKGTIVNWLHKQFMTMKQIEILYLALGDERYDELRRQYRIRILHLDN